MWDNLDKAMVDLNDIALFVKVVEVGSFTGAARALGIQNYSESRGSLRCVDCCNEQQNTKADCRKPLL